MEHRKCSYSNLIYPGVAIEAVTKVLRSGWIGLGPKVEEFAAHIGTKYAVAVNSATAALDLALKLLYVRHGG